MDKKFFSLWYRESRRHKWRMEYGFILLLRQEGDFIVFQTSSSSPTSCRLKGYGNWERKLDEPFFMEAEK